MGHPHEEPAGGEQVEVVDDKHGDQAPDQVAQVAPQHGGAAPEPGMMYEVHVQDVTEEIDRN